jgi:hypothetical protein
MLISLSSCGWIKIGSQVEPLPAVAEIPLPKLPDWIEQISPTAEATTLDQIRVRFKNPLIPLETLDDSDKSKLLDKFALIPPLPGRFRFLTPRMVGFQADSSLPLATRVKVTLKEGLQDLNKNSLAQDLEWTFNTAAIAISNLPENKDSQEANIQAIDIQPKLEFTSNAELDLDSASKYISLVPDGKNERIGLKISLVKPENETLPVEFGDPLWNYYAIPQQKLDKATRYRWEFLPGLKPLRGNLSTQNTISTYIQTYTPLKFEKIETYGKPDSSGTYGRFTEGIGQLRFNNPLIAESTLKNITIQPVPKDSTWMRAFDESNYVDLNPWALEPNTKYTITLKKDLKDKFGQTLDENTTVTYKTSDLAADFWAPTGLNIFPVTRNLNLDVSGVNLPDRNYQAAYREVKPTDLVYYNYAEVSQSGNSLLKSQDTWETFPLQGEKNKTKEASIPLRKKLNQDTGMLAYGVSAKTNEYQQDGKTLLREATYSGLVQLTNLGVFAEIFPEVAIVKVNSLDNGLAVKDARIEIYQSKLGQKPSAETKSCAISLTNSEGIAIVDGDAYKECLADFKSDYGGGPQLLFIASKGKDWAFTRTEEFGGAYGYGIDAQWEPNKILSRGTIFSDRNLYRPGETAWFTGVAYYLDRDRLQQDKNSTYSVTLQDPDGKTIDLGKQPTNEFGSFSFKVDLKKNISLGEYYLKATNDRGVEINGDFRVAEFKAPNFKVDLKLDRQFAQTGEEVKAIAQSNYLFGAPLQGGKIKYYITRQKTDFIPKGWENFSFGRQWFWPEESPEVDSSVLEKDLTLSATGGSEQILKVDENLPYPMEYRVDAGVTDVSNLSVANSQTLIALPDKRLIGLRTDYVGDAGKDFPVEVIVTDPEGKASGDRVRLELQEIKYTSVTKVSEGGLTPQNQIEYKTVATTEVNTNDKAVTATLKPSQAGSYRIRANFPNGKEETATDIQIWINGSQSIYWGDRYDNNRLSLQLDKETYKPGDTATVLIQSPYPEAELYFSVIRNNTIYKQLTKVKGSAPKIQFTVTAEMVPNAAVQVLLVRQGKPLKEVEAKTINGLMKIGFAPFKIDLGDRYLQIQTNIKSPTLLPGSEQTVEFALQKGDRAVKGQLTAMVVNESILQLTGYRPPNLVDIVYAEQPINMRFADNRPNVILEKISSPLAKGWGFGGGFSSGDPNTRTRTNFQPLAYYKGSLITDDNGKATITFKLPDDLTTWRVMVVAMDDRFNFGNAESTFMTTKPLVINPILPQFGRPGDRFQAGVAVTNNSSNPENLTLQGEVQGNLKLDAQANLNVETPVGTNAYRFPFIATQAGESQVKFNSQLNGQGDSFSVPLDIVSAIATESVIESGTTKKQVKIPLNINSQAIGGGLDISLSSTLIPEISAPANLTFQEDLPFLETAASQLAIASNLQLLGSQLSQSFAEFNPSQQAKIAIDKLAKLQKPDGGFAYYPKDDKSDPFLTPYAAQSLAKARLARSAIDSISIDRLKKYLNLLLLNPNKENYCTSAPCKTRLRLDTLIALSDLGETKNDYLASIYEQRKDLDFISQLKLNRYLFKFPEWKKEAQNLFIQLQQRVYESGRSAKVTLPNSWNWLDSNTAAQAQSLRLFIANGSKLETLDRLLQGLLSSRRNGNWGNTYDNAQALNALVEYSQLEPTPPNFNAMVELAGKKLGQFKFEGYKYPSSELQIALQDLPKGKQDLILKKSGDGTLHYLTSYKYSLPGAQPGRYNGLRVTREVRAANQDKVLRRFSIYNKEDTFKIKSGEVFDIGLEIITDREVDRVAIVDYLPAGLEPVDTSFQTTSKYFQAKADSWAIDYQKIHRDRLVAYASRLAPGVYQMHYLVRSVTPGTFSWPGAEVKLQYEPEQFGRCASSILAIE